LAVLDAELEKTTSYYSGLVTQERSRNQTQIAQISAAHATEIARLKSQQAADLAAVRRRNSEAVASLQARLDETGLALFKSRLENAALAESHEREKRDWEEQRSMVEVLKLKINEMSRSIDAAVERGLVEIESAYRVAAATREIARMEEQSFLTIGASVRRAAGTARSLLK
jgi:ribosomal protein L11